MAVAGLSPEIIGEEVFVTPVPSDPAWAKLPFKNLMEI
jgi:hypothetical protein